MTEWWTYGLSDFLMFSPRVYARLVVGYNQAAWPAQVPALAAGLALLALTVRHPSPRAAPLLLLAAAWVATGWGFHWTRYADIFLAAPWLAVGSAVQAVLLAAAVFLPARDAAAAGKSGLASIVAGVLLVPLATALAGQDVRRAEVFGLMPDPTALVTLGWLLATPALRAWPRAALAVMPVLALLLGSATRVALAQ